MFSKKKKTYSNMQNEYVFCKLQLCYLSTFNFNSLPGLKWGTNFSGTLTFSPVFGFLPNLAGL